MQKRIFLKILNTRIAKGGPFGKMYLFKNIKYKNCKGGTLWKMQKRIFLKIIILNTRIAKGGLFEKKRIFLKITNIRIAKGRSFGKYRNPSF